MSSTEVKKRKELSREDKKAKFARTEVPPLNIHPELNIDSYLEELKAGWGKDSFEKSGIKFSNKPFVHGEIQGILEDPGILKDLQLLLDYEEKSSDLFHFHQSCDLASIPNVFKGFEEIQAISQFFQTKLFNAIKTITGLPLSGKFDIFASQYEVTDHLLCHDDELDSRRVAFIIYMSEEWKEDYGGTLDLFDSIETDDSIQPGKIIKSIVPEFNKIAFFEVTAKSFHQVSEVIHKTATRLAISGWYYGEPLPRPAINLPEDSFENVNLMDRKELSLGSYLDQPYLIPETLRNANDQLSENSEILLSSFLKSDLYASVSKKLESMESAKWEPMGPPNLRRYQQVSSSDVPSELLHLFGSRNFLEFLQELTEFPFASEPELRFSCSLKKFQSGSYTLVRGKDRSYKVSNISGVSKFGENSLNEDDEHSAKEVPKKSDSPSELQIKTNGQASSVKENGSDGKSKSGENGSAEKSKSDEIESAEKSKSGENESAGKSKSGEIASLAVSKSDENGCENREPEEIEKDENSENIDEEEDAQDDDEEDAKDPDEDEAIELDYEEEGEDDDEEEIVEEEEDEAPEMLDMEGEESGEPNRVDVMFFIIPEKDSENPDGAWEESWGGNRIYTDDLTGNQLINVAPVGNSLAVVVRDASISSHFSYTNCLAQDRVFYCFDFEFDFPIGV